MYTLKSSILHDILGNLLICLFKINLFSEMIFRNTFKMLTVWIQIRPDILSGLIRIQTVCKGYQQMTNVATSRQSVDKRFSRKFMIICNLEQYVNKDMYGHPI